VNGNNTAWATDISLKNRLSRKAHRRGRRGVRPGWAPVVVGFSEKACIKVFLGWLSLRDRPRRARPSRVWANLAIDA